MPTTSHARNVITRIVVTLAVFVLALAASLFVRAPSSADTALGAGAIHVYDAHITGTTFVAESSADVPSADGPVRVEDRIQRSSRQADETLGDEDAAALDAGEDIEAVNRDDETTWEWEQRKSLGRDGGESEIGIERQNGEAISRVHRVTREGEVIHQHQEHIGKYGGERSFPNEWVQYPEIELP